MSGAATARLPAEPLSDDPSGRLARELELAASGLSRSIVKEKERAVPVERRHVRPVGVGETAPEGDARTHRCRLDSVPGSQWDGWNAYADVVRGRTDAHRGWLAYCERTPLAQS